MVLGAPRIREHLQVVLGWPLCERCLHHHAGFGPGGSLRRRGGLWLGQSQLGHRALPLWRQGQLCRLPMHARHWGDHLTVLLRH